MSDNSDGSDMERDLSQYRRKDNVGSAQLPPHPGLRAYRHVSVAHLRETKTILANNGLLEAAEGGYPPKVLLLKDVDISRLYSADPEKLAALTHKARQKNSKNAERRNLWMLEAWTKIYASLSDCCRTTCPALHEELYALCGLESRGVRGGYMDGPLAFRLYVASLEPAVRTKADRDYYERMLTLMRKHHLPANCSGHQYLSKATAFIVHVYQNVARPFEAEQAGEELIQFMPTILAADGRRLTDALRVERALGDLRHVAKKCEEVVEAARDPTVATPAAVVHIEQLEIGGRSLRDATETCGMALAFLPQVAAVAGNLPSSGGGAVGKYCSGCPHVNRNGKTLECFANPAVQMTWPPSIFARKDLVQAYEALRKANASKAGVPYVPIAEPSPEAIAIHLAGARRPPSGARRAPAGGAQHRTRAPAAKASAMAVTDDFMSSIKDFSEEDFDTTQALVAVANYDDPGPMGDRRPQR